MSEVADPLPFVSVIIPTYNRKDSLLRTLASLEAQTYSKDRFEVIVVDDAETDRILDLDPIGRPYPLTVLRPGHRGATEARNVGARAARGVVLVFMDDDITLEASSLQALVTDLVISSGAIVTGSLSLPDGLDQIGHVSNTALSSTVPELLHDRPAQEIPFVHCMTGLLAVRRSHFDDLGGFEDPTGGWPNWDDVDFGYRAHLAGLSCLRSDRATATHWDYAASSLEASCVRWRRASHAAARLFLRYPDIKNYLPMFVDKEPICWRADAARLILRKLARQVASSRLAMAGMQAAVPVLERRDEERMLRILYRWIVSGYIYRGYRQGLREVHAAAGTPSP